MPAPDHPREPSAADPTPNAPRRRLLAAGVTAASAGLLPRAFAQSMAGMNMQSMAAMPDMAMARPRALPQARAAHPAAFSRRLDMPRTLLGEPGSDGVLRYALRMQPGSSELLGGVATPTWGYNGAFLGPALRVPRGRPVAITVANALNQSSTTHWHGAHVPGAMDGGPQSLIEPGRSLQVRFALEQPAATLWYHPHPDTRTGPHVWAGLAGLLLVDDGLDARLGLPHTWGVDDIPLVLQDRRFDARGRLSYMPDGMMDMMGMKGDRFLVNGREQPYVELPAQWVRLRILNGSNARIYNLAFSDRRGFHMVGSDAGLLERAVEMRSLLLGPAERAELLVDLRAMHGRTLVLRSDSGDIVPQLGSSMGDSDAWDHSGFDLLQIRVVAPRGTPGRLAARLAELETLRPTLQQPRTFTLQGMSANMGRSMGTRASMGGMGAMQSGGAQPATRGPGAMSLGMGGQPMFSINHRFMDMRVIDQKVKLGATEVWEVRNDSGMAHPFHMHGTSFRIVERDGKPAAEHERGWKDVVLVRRRETVRLVMRFDQPAGVDHPYMYHCHILEHEDNGMMGQFTVT